MSYSASNMRPYGSPLHPPTRSPFRSPSPSSTSPHLYRPRSTSFRLQTPSPLIRLLLFFNLPIPSRYRHLRTTQTTTLRTLYTPLALLLIPLWFLLILHHEHWAYSSAINACNWESWERWPTGAKPYRVALVADPQLVDVHTYARRGPALWATIFYTDLYMRRNWEVMQNELAPQDTIFLGDLFDGGREWAVADHRDMHHSEESTIPKDPRGEKDWRDYGNSYWFREYARFLNIFPTMPGSRVFRSLPGNHDLGFGGGVKRSVRERFESYFGETNGAWAAGNHSFIALDTVSLSNEHDPQIYSPSTDFLSTLPLKSHPTSAKFPHTLSTTAPSPPTNPAEIPLSLPTILLTHVPLYRPANTPCGAHRERGTSIPIWQGYQYQNVLSQTLSQKLLTTLNPRYIFSGDDHDACELQHPGTHAFEVTVKSASWAMGIRRPAYYLLSMWNPERTDKSGTVQGHWCETPDMIGYLLRYVWMAVFTGVCVAVEVGLEGRRRAKKGKEPVLPGGGGEGKYWKPGRGSRRGGVREWGMRMGRLVGVVVPGYVLIVWWW